MDDQKQETVGDILDEMEGIEHDPHIVYDWDLVQHTPEWLQARAGIITASVMPQLITHGELDAAMGETAWAICYNLAVQRITGEAGDSYQSYDMKRGILDEPEITRLYAENFRKIKTCGFIKNTRHGFRLGYSPDGIWVHGEGQIEGKSREPSIQLRMINDPVLPKADMIQVQTGLLVSEKPVCDYISYCNGMRFVVKPVEPDYKMMAAILSAARTAEDRIEEIVFKYKERVLNDPTLIETPKVERELF